MYTISLLHTALIACIMHSVSHEFKPDILWILLAEILKKHFIKFINPALLLILKGENYSAELKTMCYLCRYRRILNQGSPRFLELLKPSNAVEF